MQNDRFENRNSNRDCDLAAGLIMFAVRERDKSNELRSHDSRKFATWFLDPEARAIIFTKITRN